MADIPTLREGMVVKAGGKEWVLDQLITYSHTLRSFDQTCVNCNGFEPTSDEPCAPPTVRLAREKSDPRVRNQLLNWSPGNTVMGQAGAYEPVPALNF